MYIIYTNVCSLFVVYVYYCIQVYTYIKNINRIYKCWNDHDNSRYNELPQKKYIIVIVMVARVGV